MSVPNSTIVLYSGIPLDNSYNHTIYFASATSQREYFGNNNIVATLSNQYYTRLNRGRIRVQVPSIDMFNVNYMAFKNTSHENKWFYAFVTSVEYINENVYEFDFELDVIQSYMFDITFRECYVEREHPTTDVIGANKCSEPKLTEFVYDSVEDYAPNPLATKKYLLLAESGPEVTSPTVNHYYINSSPFVGYAVLCDSMSDLNEELEKYTSLEVAGFSLGTTDRIIGIFEVPSIACSVSSSSSISNNVLFSDGISRPTDVNGYTPKNNKMLQYPFIKIEVSNRKGMVQEFAFEEFDLNSNPNHKAYFNLIADCGINDDVMIAPVGYHGISLPNFDYAVYTSYRKNVPYKENNFNTVDVIKGITTAARGASERSISRTASSASQLASMSNPSVASVGAIANRIGNVVGEVAHVGWDAVETGEDIIFSYPPVNNVNNTNIICNMGYSPFTIRVYALESDIAARYDEYFQKYGYAMNNVKIPTRYGRKRHNYVKTRGCLVKGKAPTNIISKIEDIHDKGITYWHSPSYVGIYTDDDGELLDNSPIS